MNFCDFTVLIASVFPDSGSQNGRSDKSRCPAHRVNGGRTGKIDKAHLRKPSLRIPNPTRLNGIDHCADNGRIETVCAELGPFGHGSGYDGRSSGTKHQIEHKA